MSQDWIKVRVDLSRDPRVLGIARRLGVSRQHVVGCLVAVWGLADQHAVPRPCPGGDGTISGHLSGYALADVDEAASQPGLAGAMAACGWLAESPDGVDFPDWDVHHSKSAKARAYEQKRKRGQRRASRREGDTCPGIVPEGPGPEKRREEEYIPPTPPSGGGVSASASEQQEWFAAVWEAYPVGKRCGRAAALEAWDGLPPSEELAARVVAALESQKALPDWARRAPGLARYLRERRWEDAPGPQERAPRRAPAAPAVSDEQRQAALEEFRRRKGG